MAKASVHKIHAHRGLTSHKIALQAHLNDFLSTLTALDFLFIMVSGATARESGQIQNRAALDLTRKWLYFRIVYLVQVYKT